jgi:flagellar biosynthetic protein FliQ
MTMEQIVQLGRATMETALWVCGPILANAVAICLLINLVQVLTSLQEPTLSTVPRLLVVGLSAILLMPWMLRQLANFTVHLLSSLPRYAR